MEIRSSLSVWLLKEKKTRVLYHDLRALCVITPYDDIVAS